VPVTEARAYLWSFSSSTTQKKPIRQKHYAGLAAPRDAIRSYSRREPDLVCYGATLFRLSCNLQPYAR